MTEVKERIAAQAEKTREVLRKGFLAYIGMYGAAYDRLQAKYGDKATGLFEEFLNKGEEMEAKTQETVEEVRARASERYGDRIERVRNVLPEMPTLSNDNTRVAELENEVEALNKKIAALTKKVGGTTTKTKKAA